MERLAIVGLGKIAQFHLQALHTLDPTAHVEVIGGFDVDSARRPAYGGRSLPVFRSLDELLAQEPTAVLVTTPTTNHYETCTKILASPHRPAKLIVEKPISSSLAEAEELLRTTDGSAPSANLTELIAIYHAAHAPEVRWATEQLERWRSEHGDMVAFDATFADPYRDLDRSVRDKVYVNSWFDSGINALSVALRFLPLAAVERVTCLDDTNSVYEAEVRFEAKSDDASFTGRGHIRTAWDVDEPAKASEFRFADGTSLLLDHQGMSGALSGGGRHIDSFQETDAVPRLVRHYQDVFTSIFITYDGYYSTQQSLLLHRLLFWH
jgi:predicted dehydrogenase